MEAKEVGQREDAELQVHTQVHHIHPLIIYKRCEHDRKREGSCRRARLCEVH